MTELQKASKELLRQAHESLARAGATADVLDSHRILNLAVSIDKLVNGQEIK